MAEPWQPLAGVRVVDFSMFVPGPFAAAIFADLGAEVLKVEPPAGDPCRSYLPLQFRTENRNKRSLALDLKQEGAKEVVARLAAQAAAPQGRGVTQRDLRNRIQQDATA